MNCDEAVTLLAAEVDGEVDTLRAHGLRKHCATCPTCSPRLAELRALRQALRAELPRHAASASLRARVAEAAGRSLTRPKPRDTRWRWFTSGALTGGLAAGLLWLAATGWLPVFVGDDFPARLTRLHTAATLENRPIQVASSDRHTVKPWLSARLDYTIPVVDAAADGFPLRGARIDRLDGRPVAVLVYAHGLHSIDVVVRPEVGGAPQIAGRIVRGFSLAAAQSSGMEWLAVSDLNAPELAAFVEALAQGRLGQAPSR